MSVKRFIKKCMWIMLVLLTSFLVIRKGQFAADNIWIDGEPSFRYYAALIWEIWKEIAIFFPAWLLSLLGLARACFGDNWLPFAEIIPARVTKMTLVAAVTLLIGVTAVGSVYSEYTEDSYVMQDRMENMFGRLETMLVWVVYYGILLYTEQWCIRKNCGWQSIRQRQAWITVTIFLTFLIVVCLNCADLWYIPLKYVDSPNRLEDYSLWWFSLYMAVFILPLWFFSVRKTIRLFKNHAQWLTLSTIIPRKITVLIALMLTGLVVWQIQENQYYCSMIPSLDVPEYAEAAATGHVVQAMIWGLALFYMIRLLVKQTRAARREKHEQAGKTVHNL